MIFRFIIAVMLIALLGEQAQACTCSRVETALEQADSADVIFIGRAKETNRIERKKTVWDYILFWQGDREPDWERRYITVFEIEKSLKGLDQGTVSISHGQNGEFCGVSFERQHSRLVLAYVRDDGSYGTSLCGMPQHSAEDFALALE
ncbi:MAG: hypothetical protein ABJG15_03935 [Hyphomonadaceae bacterium]